MISLKNKGALPSVTQDEFEWGYSRIRAFFLREHNEDGTHTIPEAATNFMPIGGQIVWPTDAAPAGWLFCRGQAVSRVSYKSLFEVLGVRYGAGDGLLTFNIPNLQGRAPYGKATSGTGSTLGGSFGSMDHTHSFSDTSSTDGAHSHSVNAHRHAISGAGTAAAGVDVTVRASSTQDDIFDDSGTSTTGDHTHAVSGTTGSASPPGLAENWIIYTGVVA
jgi:microcystin-dependent protein